MTDQQEPPMSRFTLDPKLIKRLVTGRLDEQGEVELAEQVARLIPFHADLPVPLVGEMTRLSKHLGGEAAIVDWLDHFPGRPRIVARSFVFIELLERFSAEPAVVRSCR
jgi:hypothetical protein